MYRLQTTLPVIVCGARNSELLFQADVLRKALKSKRRQNELLTICVFTTVKIVKVSSFFETPALALLNSLRSSSQRTYSRRCHWQSPKLAHSEDR